MTTLYFTGTGNSLYVAKRIGGQLLSIPQLIKEEIYQVKDDAVGIVFPCYGFSVPKIVEDYIMNAQIEADYVFTVMTYGGWPMSGLRHMEKILAKKGVLLSYANEVSMVNNSLITYKVEEQLEIKKPDAKISEIVLDIHARKNQIIRKSALSNFASAATHRLTNALGSSSMFQSNFIINGACTSCGVCQAVCPAGNITVNPKEKPAFGKECASCMGCINHCPQDAMHHKREQSGVKYHHPGVSLSEIIKSNCQNENMVKVR